MGDIKFVRTPRTAHSGKDKESIGYAFLEFGSPDECKAAYTKLQTTQFKGKELVVDFVGENSKNKKQKAQAAGDQTGSRLNPTRLFICGLAPGVNKSNLKEMFPKASHADIPARSRKKGTSYGFVQFASPGDAKAAFDAAKDLTIAGHKITVLFAKMTEAKPEVVQKKAEKRKLKEEKDKKEKIEAKKIKVDGEEEENGEESEEEENDEESEEEDAKEVKTEKLMKEESGEDDENDEESEDEESEDGEGAAKEEESEEDDDDDDDDE